MCEKSQGPRTSDSENCNERNFQTGIIEIFSEKVMTNLNNQN